MDHAIFDICKSVLDKYASAINVPAHGEVVFSNINKFVNENSLFTRFLRRLKRDAIMVVTFQAFLVKPRIPKRARKILYVYLGTPNLGDSIMDLSPRLLWADSSLQVEMYTHKNIADFYRGDYSFSRIICDPSELGSNYDFIVLQSYSWRCLKFKWRYYFFVEFSTLHGHYYGCEFNRLAYASGAWRYLLNLPLDKSALVRPVFNLGFGMPKKTKREGFRIAVAIGGIVDWRTYSFWGEVMSLVSREVSSVTWVLLGSENGTLDSEKLQLIEELQGSLVNYVNRLSLHEVALQLNSANMLIAADGGLLNIARTTYTPIVGLFARDIHPLMRFESSDRAYAIHALNAVNEISPRLVCEAAVQLLSGRSKSLTVKYLAEEPDCNLC